MCEFLLYFTVCVCSECSCAFVCVYASVSCVVMTVAFILPRQPIHSRWNNLAMWSDRAFGLRMLLAHHFNLIGISVFNP